MNDIKKQKLELRERVSAVRTQQNYIESQLILYIKTLDDLIYTIHTPKHEFLFKSTFKSSTSANNIPSIVLHPDLLYSEYIHKSVSTLLDTIHDQYCSKKWNIKLSGLSKIHTQINLLFASETTQTFVIEIDLRDEPDTISHRYRLIGGALVGLRDVVNQWPSILEYDPDLYDFHKIYSYSSPSFAKAAVAIKQKRMQHICNLVAEGKAVPMAVNFVDYICNVMISAACLYAYLNGGLEYPYRGILEVALMGSDIQNKPWWIKDDDDSTNDRRPPISHMGNHRTSIDRAFRYMKEEAEKKRGILLPVMDSQDDAV